MNAPSRPPITIEGPKTPALPPEPIVNEVAIILKMTMSQSHIEAKEYSPCILQFVATHKMFLIFVEGTFRLSRLELHQLQASKLSNTKFT